MKKCIALLAVAALAVIVAGVSAQEKKIKMSDLPPAVRKTVDEQTKSAQLKGLSRETEKGNTIYEAELTVNGHGKDVSMDSDGKIVEVEEEMPLSEVPEAARSAIESAAKGGKVLKVEAVSHNGDGGMKVEAYEAVVKKGAKKTEVRFNSAGQAVKED